MRIFIPEKSPTSHVNLEIIVLHELQSGVGVEVEVEIS